MPQQESRRTKGAPPAGRVYWLTMVLFSIYLPLLIVTTHQVRWSTTLYIAWMSRYAPEMRHRADPNNRILQLVTFLLVWFLAFVVYLSASLLERIPRTRALVGVFVGMVGFVGYPALCWYFNFAPLLALELVVGAACVCAWALKRWPVPATVSFLLLCIHFAFWSAFGGGDFLEGGWYLLWPGYLRTSRLYQYGWLTYPLLGLVLVLLWGARVSHSTVLTNSRGEAIQ
jgi:hypothetical protein